MTPLKVYFTNLEIDPNDLVPRICYGIIPQHWHRHRFVPDEAISVTQVNRWLTEHIDGRWAIYSRFTAGKRQITIAFELDYDGSMFVLADGAHQCLMLPDWRPK